MSGKMKLLLNVLSVFVAVTAVHVQAQKKIELFSPGKEIKVNITLSDKIYYDISYGNELLLQHCYLQMDLEKQILGSKPELLSHKISRLTEEIKPVVPLKYLSVKSDCNLLQMKFRGNYSVEFKAFDDGIAYRFVTDMKNESIVKGEDMVIRFPENYLAYLSQTSSFKTSYEHHYKRLETNAFHVKKEMTTLPVLIDTRKQNYKILISEADLSDYPCMFLKGTNNNGMQSVFPNCPLEFGDDGDRSQKILKEADYIAKTTGKRSYPWRYFVLTKNDGQLIENEMTLKLSSRNVLDDISWIKPGLASWEWWNEASPYGPDVNFVAGFNLETYKYYIDFAAKFGIDYIIMDEGWAKTTFDPYTPNPTVDVHELIRYGKSKNVGVVLWLTWLTVEKNFDLFKTFSEWGVKGIKIDFMDRSDQWMVNYYERVAKEAAKYHLFVDFHGSFKPAGLECMYPNVLSYEGLPGLEQGGGCFPDNNILFPFIRNAVGPMDFTPGAMINMQPDVYSARRPNNAGMGTRANQMAMFVLYESGLQMLADNPTLYYRNEDCTRFITQVPVTWDETKALQAVAGEYLVVAKRKGDKWFVGAMCNGKETTRDIEIDLSFLTSGKNYEMTSFEDGINAGKQAMDYRRKVQEVNSARKMTVHMVRNGGFAAVIQSR